MRAGGTLSSSPDRNPNSAPRTHTESGNILDEALNIDVLGGSTDALDRIDRLTKAAEATAKGLGREGEYTDAVCALRAAITAARTQLGERAEPGPVAAKLAADLEDALATHHL